MKVIKNKKYLMDIMNDYRMVFIVMLLPAFLLGWKLGKEKGVGKNVSKLIRFGLLTALTYIRKQFIGGRGF